MEAEDWCQTRPATTGEHKFKATDLARMIDGTTLIWGNGDGEYRELRGRGAIQRDKHGVVKFPKSLCDRCINARSQPFDRAYETFSAYLVSHPRLHTKRGIDLRRIYGSDWKDPVLNLARYYGKHFGCQMVTTGVGVPDSLRAFLDGTEDMPDIHMALLTTDSIHETFDGKGLHLSPVIMFGSPEYTEIRGCVGAAYIGAVGVRFAWTRAGIPDEQRSQFFHFPFPLINRFTDELAVVNGNPSGRR